jgi:hypothetical protein
MSSTPSGGKPAAFEQLALWVRGTVNQGVLQSSSILEAGHKTLKAFDGPLHKIESAAPTVLKLARAMQKPVLPFAHKPTPHSEDMLVAQEMLRSALYGRLVSTVKDFPVRIQGRTMKITKRLHPSRAKWQELERMADDDEDDADTAVNSFENCVTEFMKLMTALHRYVVATRTHAVHTPHTCSTCTPRTPPAAPDH